MTAATAVDSAAATAAAVATTAAAETMAAAATTPAATPAAAAVVKRRIVERVDTNININQVVIKRGRKKVRERENARAKKGEQSGERAWRGGDSTRTIFFILDSSIF